MNDLSLIFCSIHASSQNVDVATMRTEYAALQVFEGSGATSSGRAWHPNAKLKVISCYLHTVSARCSVGRREFRCSGDASASLRTNWCLKQKRSVIRSAYSFTTHYTVCLLLAVVRCCCKGFRNGLRQPSPCPATAVCERLGMITWQNA